MDLFSSFSSLSLAAKMYFVIGTFSTALMVIQLITTAMGFDHGHDDLDFSHDVDHDLSGIEGITFFSIRSIVAFFCFFGWVGYICVQAGLWALISVVPAFCAGAVALVAVAYLLHFFYSMAESGTQKIEDAISEIGTVYLSIPAGKNETGAVNVSVAGAQREYKAVSENGAMIKTGAKVQVVGMLDQRTLIVKEATQPSEWMEEGLS